MVKSSVTYVIFDVYGTVVDWRSSVIAEAQALGERKGIEGVDWEAFTDAWKAAYRPSMDEVNAGRRPWTTHDVLQRQRLDVIAGEFGLQGLSEADKDGLNRAWHRLQPWPDSVKGLTRLTVDEDEKYSSPTLPPPPLPWFDSS